MSSKRTTIRNVPDVTGWLPTILRGTMNSGERTQVSRRTLARGAVWATPAVLVATVAPAYAASGDTVNPTNASSACKRTPGGEVYYDFTLVFKNSGTVATTACLTGGTMYPNGCSAVNINTSTIAPAGGCVVVQPGQTATFTATSLVSSCGANGYMVVTYTYTDANGNTVTTSAQTTFNSVKPC